MTEHYPKADKWTILEALPHRSWNMIYQRALALGLHRSAYIQDPTPDSITVGDLRVFPDREVGMSIVSEAVKQRTYACWLYSAEIGDLAQELEHHNSNADNSASQRRSG